MILSIDPGKETGVVLLSGPLQPQPGRVLKHYTTQPYDGHSIIVQHPTIDYLIIEQPPERGNSPLLLELFGSLVRYYLDSRAKHLMALQPGYWKPVVKTLQLVAPQELRPHEKDAYLMAMVWLRSFNSS